MIFQDPHASLNPRMTIGSIIAEPLDSSRARRRAERRGAGARAAATTVGLDRRLRQPLPARVLRRPAPAHRHRPGAGARPEVHRLRRADLRARRLDPGADHQPARSTCRSDSGSPTSSSPTTSRWCATSRDRVAVMYLGRIAEIAPPPRLYARPLHPYTRGAALGGARARPGGRARRRRISSRATCRARSTRRRAAASTPAARRSSDRCRVEVPALLDKGDGRHVACHLQDQPKAAA